VQQAAFYKWLYILPAELSSEDFGQVTFSVPGHHWSVPRRSAASDGAPWKSGRDADYSSQLSAGDAEHTMHGNLCELPPHIAIDAPSLGSYTGQPLSVMHSVWLLGIRSA